MVTDQGGIDDRSFNASAWAGLEAAAEDTGIEVQYVTSKSESDYTPNVNSLVAEDCGIIVTVGFSLGDATKTAANENPDETFTIVDENPTNDGEAIENVKPLLFNTAEAAYLGGYLAAGMTETGTVATFGGVEAADALRSSWTASPTASDKYNEDNGADVKLLGWDKEKQDGSFAGKFDAPTDGKNLAKNFIQQGADIIMPVAGEDRAGCRRRCPGVRWRGVHHLGRRGRLRVRVAVQGGLPDHGREEHRQRRRAATTVDTVNGNFDNTPFIGTLANDGVGLAPYHDFESQGACRA